MAIAAKLATVHAASAADDCLASVAPATSSAPYPSASVGSACPTRQLVATALKRERRVIGPTCSGRPAAMRAASRTTTACIAIDSTSWARSVACICGVIENARDGRSCGRSPWRRFSSVKCDRAPPRSSASGRHAARRIRQRAPSGGSVTWPGCGEHADARDRRPPRLGLDRVAHGGGVVGDDPHVEGAPA